MNRFTNKIILPVDRSILAKFTLTFLWMNFAIFSALAEVPAPEALPAGGRVIQGEGNFQYQGNQLKIWQHSDRMINEWARFDVGEDATVNFIQPGRDSIALNRVFSNDPSQIFGKVTSTGQLFLVNGSGVIFGESARIDTGSFRFC